MDDKPKDMPQPQMVQDGKPASKTPEEVQELKSAIIRDFTERHDEMWELKDLEITDADRNRFLECLLTNVRYEETFVRINGKIRVTVQSRYKKESDILARTLTQEMRTGEVLTPAEYIDHLNLYRMLTQITMLDGLPQEPVDLTVPDFSFKKATQDSIFVKMPDIKIYILVGILTQFEHKVLTMAREALEPNFSNPVAAT